MKSKTSSFNRTLITSLWKRFWPLFGAYFTIWLLLLPLPLGNMLAWNLRNADHNNASDIFASVGQTILNGGVSAGIYSFNVNLGVAIVTTNALSGILGGGTVGSNATKSITVTATGDTNATARVETPTLDAKAGMSCGTVMVRNWLHPTDPSKAAASLISWGMPWRPER